MESRPSYPAGSYHLKRKSELGCEGVLVPGEGNWGSSINIRKNTSKAKNVPRDKEDPFITQDPLQQEVIILNTFVPKNRASKYTKHKPTECNKK